MNWYIIITVGAIVMALIIFLIYRNQKDKKAFEKKLNNDYHKHRNNERDIEINELTNKMY